MPSRKDRKRPRIVDLSALLEALTKTDIDFIIVGGLAAVAQGAPITTMDMDIVHRQSNDNIDKLLAFLKKIDAIHRRPDDKILEPQNVICRGGATHFLRHVSARWPYSPLLRKGEDTMIYSPIRWKLSSGSTGCGCCLSRRLSN